MTHTPIISIIMPIYNAADTLRASIQSVRNQSYTQWELILIDDGSTDSSCKIAKELAVLDRRIQLHRQNNSGPSHARNHGLARSHGQYISFLDADDQWSPKRLSTLLAAFEANAGAGVVFSRVQFFDLITGKKGALTRHIEQLNIQTLLAENPACTTSNIMCRRSVVERVGGFKSGLDYAEDQDWLLRVALDGTYSIQGVDMIGLYYASSPDSLSANLENMHKGWQWMMAHAMRVAPAKVAPLRKHASARFHRYLCRRALRKRQPKIALGYLCRALEQDPLLLVREPKRTWLTLFGTLALFTKITHLEELVIK